MNYLVIRQTDDEGFAPSYSWQVWAPRTGRVHVRGLSFQEALGFYRKHDGVA